MAESLVTLINNILGSSSSLKTYSSDGEFIVPKTSKYYFFVDPPVRAPGRGGGSGAGALYAYNYTAGGTFVWAACGQDGTTGRALIRPNNYYILSADLQQGETVAVTNNVSMLSFGNYFSISTRNDSLDGYDGRSRIIMPGGASTELDRWLPEPVRTFWTTLSHEDIIADQSKVEILYNPLATITPYAVMPGASNPVSGENYVEKVIFSTATSQLINIHGIDNSSSLYKNFLKGQEYGATIIMPSEGAKATPISLNQEEVGFNFSRNDIIAPVESELPNFEARSGTIYIIG